MAEASLTDGLEAEYEAIFAYGAAGAHLSGELRDAAVAADRHHRDRRDTVIAHLEKIGEEVPTAAAVYALETEIVDEKTAAQLLDDIETHTCQVWRSTLANLSKQDRRVAANAFANSAVTAAAWRRAQGESPSTTPFPGRP